MMCILQGGAGVEMKESRPREEKDENRPSKRSRRDKSRSRSRSNSPIRQTSKNGTVEATSDPTLVGKPTTGNAIKVTYLPTIINLFLGSQSKRDSISNCSSGQFAPGDRIDFLFSSQLASVTSMLENVKRQQGRKAEYRPLLLDASGCTTVLFSSALLTNLRTRDRRERKSR
jgi:hypothetical protein